MGVLTSNGLSELQRRIGGGRRTLAIPNGFISEAINLLWYALRRRRDIAVGRHYAYHGVAVAEHQIFHHLR
jgi:hypothetical protein